MERAITSATGWAAVGGRRPALGRTRARELAWASPGATAVYSDTSAASSAFGASGSAAAASSTMRDRR
ncbi:MAG: hypothetical protein V8S24_05130 [Gordonibacter pamelaeae]